MTTGGEGGMVTTNDHDLWSRMWSYKDHGKSWDAMVARDHPPGFRWLHESFGTNGRMLEMQAAIGRIQLQRMAAWTRRRAAHAARLTEICRRHAVVRAPVVPDDRIHAWYRFCAFVVPERLAAGWSRDRIIETITAAGVPCYQGICPEIYREKAFADAGLQPSRRLPVARQLGETCLTFLVHPTLTEEEIDTTCRVFDDTLRQAGASGKT